MCVCVCVGRGERGRVGGGDKELGENRDTCIKDKS